MTAHNPVIAATEACQLVSQRLFWFVAGPFALRRVVVSELGVELEFTADEIINTILLSLTVGFNVAPNLSPNSRVAQYQHSAKHKDCGKPAPATDVFVQKEFRG